PSTVRAALVLAARQPLPAGLAPAEVIALTKEVCNAMLLSKLKLTALLFALIVLASGVGLAKYQPQPDPAPKERDEAAKAAPAPARDQGLRKQKLSAAAAGFAAAQEEFPAGKSTAEDLYAWSKRWLDAEREVNNDRTGHLAALKAHNDRMKGFEDVQKQRHEA